MFDHIKVDPKYLTLPEDQGELQDHDWSKEVFQTKDGHNVLGQYEIKRKRLYFTEPVAGDSDIVRDLNIIKFYGSILKDHHDYDYWFEWSATLSNGRLERVDLTKWEEEDNSERKRIYKEINQKIADGKIRSTKTWYKCYKHMWRPPVRFMFKRYRVISCWLNNVITFIERKLLPW